MKKNFLFGTIIFCVVIFAGCARIQEVSKTIWGSSTRALDEARSEAISKDFNCSFEECFRDVLKIAELEEFEVFIKDKSQKHIVFMGIKGSLDTTEVGVFFAEINDQTVKIEITSLSTNAKKKVAEILFPQLAKIYPEHN